MTSCRWRYSSPKSICTSQTFSWVSGKYRRCGSTCIDRSMVPRSPASQNPLMMQMVCPRSIQLSRKGTMNGCVREATSCISR